MAVKYAVIGIWRIFLVIWKVLDVIFTNIPHYVHLSKNACVMLKIDVEVELPKSSADALVRRQYAGYEAIVLFLVRCLSNQ